MIKLFVNIPHFKQYIPLGNNELFMAAMLPA